jgi:hypothetical protein
VLAQERHVVHAPQDAAVGRLGEEKPLLVQDAKRGRWQVLAAKFPGIRPVISWRVARRPDAVTLASKIVNSVPA